MLKISSLTLALLVLLVLPGSQAEAQNMSCTVRVVHATKGGGKVDSRLGGLAKTLKTSFDGYGSFSLLQSRELKISMGGTKSMGLPNGLTLSLKFVGRKNKRNTFVLQIPPKLRGMNASLDDGGTFYQVLKPYKGGIMILPITCRAQ